MGRLPCAPWAGTKAPLAEPVAGTSVMTGRLPVTLARPVALPVGDVRLTVARLPAAPPLPTAEPLMAETVMSPVPPDAIAPEPEPLPWAAATGTLRTTVPTVPVPLALPVAEPVGAVRATVAMAPDVEALVVAERRRITSRGEAALG